GPQLLEVVDLADVRHPDGSVARRHGLMPAGEVDDAEAPVTEANAVGQVEPLVVRAAVDHAVPHAPNEALVHRTGGHEAGHPADAAHGDQSPRSFLRRSRAVFLVTAKAENTSIRSWRDRRAGSQASAVARRSGAPASRARTRGP